MNIKSLVRGRENEIISYILDFYDVELHGEEHWFAYFINRLFTRQYIVNHSHPIVVFNKET